MNAPTRVFAGVVVASGVLTVSVVALEGMHLTPYRDVGGVWTVCAGVTGALVIPGKTYTLPECMEMTTGSITKHANEVLACTPTTRWKQHEFDAITSLAYNVGASTVCRSGLGDLLRANRMAEACTRIKSYSNVRVDGALRSCKDPVWNCRGVWLRRQAESNWCLTGQAPT